nr:MAG: hypothetical protein [Bacteriophage sp.]
MVNFDNVTTGIPQKLRKKTMAESLEEAKQEGRLVVPEEDKQENAVVSIETVQSKSDKPKKKKRVKVRKDGEQTVAVSQEDNDFKDAKTDKRGVPVGINVPQHILDVVCIVKFNAAFRRHTSLNILHTLEDDGRICNSKGAYVDFLWNKFRVTADGGLRREYRYTDDLFIDALVKAHADVASDSQRVIGIMIDTETELHKKNKDSEAS